MIGIKLVIRKTVIQMESAKSKTIFAIGIKGFLLNKLIGEENSSSFENEKELRVISIGNAQNS